MAQSHASVRRERDDVWDESRDWGFDDRTLRPRSYPRSAPVGERARVPRRVSGPVAADPAQRARSSRDTGEFPRLQAVDDTGEFARVHDTGEFARVHDTGEFARVESSHETGEFSAVHDTGEFEQLHDPQHEADRARYGARTDGSRRTVLITGRGSEHHRPAVTRSPGRRPAQRVYERPGFNPDRIAMWAVLLGVVLILVAATSSHAAVLQAHHAVAHLLRAR